MERNFGERSTKRGTSIHVLVDVDAGALFEEHSSAFWY